MERLTERDEFGNADIIGVDSEDLQLNLDFEQMNKVTDALNKLSEYEDLEELIGLPLKELAKIFRQHIPDGCQHPQKAIVLTDGDVDKWREYQKLYDDNSLDSYRGYLGNEVFLTKAEAEAKLEELRGDKNEVN